MTALALSVPGIAAHPGQQHGGLTDHLTGSGAFGDLELDTYFVGDEGKTYILGSDRDYGLFVFRRD